MWAATRFGLFREELAARGGLSVRVRLDVRAIGAVGVSGWKRAELRVRSTGAQVA